MTREEREYREKAIQDDMASIENRIRHTFNQGCELGRRLAQEPKTEWIPVSERLPNDRDWYLGIFKEPDTGWINPLPFICDYVGHETKATTKECWILRGHTDRDERIDYYFNLECVAWQPLPKPYKLQESEVDSGNDNS